MIVSLSWDDGNREDAAIVKLCEQLGISGMTFYPTFPVQDWGVYRGFEVGNHTVAHPNLTKIEPDAIRRELTTASDGILAATGVLPTSFAYPYGAYNPSVVSAVKSFGFLLARTTCRGRHPEPFHLEPDSNCLYEDFWGRYEAAWETGAFVGYGHSNELGSGDAEYMIRRLAGDGVRFMSHTDYYLYATSRPSCLSA